MFGYIATVLVNSQSVQDVVTCLFSSFDFVYILYLYNSSALLKAARMYTLQARFISTRH